MENPLVPHPILLLLLHHHHHHCHLLVGKEAWVLYKLIIHSLRGAGDPQRESFGDPQRESYASTWVFLGLCTDKWCGGRRMGLWGVGVQ